MSYHINHKGFYGDFGGAFVPEMLQHNVDQLQAHYLQICESPEFQQRFHQLLKDYVGRPSPLYLSEKLSEALQCQVFLKREDLNHTGAHKINNTIGQILLAKQLGKTRIIAETGAGQHGVATATVCALMNMECVIHMGAKDIERQAPNVSRIKMLGATVVPAYSGSQSLKDATNEAIRDWIRFPKETHYIIGSVVGPAPYPDMVARFQSVIGYEIAKQLEAQTGTPYPDYLIACVGGGSNAAGAFYPFLDHPKVALLLAEAAGEGIASEKTAATGLLGTTGILHGSKSLMMQNADGQVKEAHSISAGLDYPGIGPMHANLIKTGRATSIGVTDTEALEAGLALSKEEGIIPALESAHALAVLQKHPFQKGSTIVLNLSGRGDKDLAQYQRYFTKKATHENK